MRENFSTRKNRLCYHRDCIALETWKEHYFVKRLEGDLIAVDVNSRIASQG